MRMTAQAVGLGVLLLAGSAVADDGEPPDPAEDGPSRSVGTADHGSLEHAARVPDSPLLLIRNDRGRFGTTELVSAIVRAAEHVERAQPGSRLFVGDLSRRHGGRFGTHRSHQSGRDVDLGFYLVDSRGRPAHLNRWLDLDFMGRATFMERRYRFDMARNWELIAALVNDPGVMVQYVFAMYPVRQLLLRQAEAIGAPEETVRRVRAVMRPDPGNEHRSHFHVRIYCPVDHRPACIDEPPYHDWYRGPPPAEDVAEAIARHRRWQRRQDREAAAAAAP